MLCHVENLIEPGIAMRQVIVRDDRWRYLSVSLPANTGSAFRWYVPTPGRRKEGMSTLVSMSGTPGRHSDDSERETPARLFTL